ncbi:DUF6262 family protein [Carnobacterium maltaromaticum]|uniref:DUF6262 family protein n=1 Tax=Carnobacterium maltaromaticum TaxID=2751 RepID=A0AAW9JW97_CARML|nr:DUF6262 family protein [Carnobacterium maltaromaticum]MDZ5760792.1 DUF6262 family protein [Carnobacterium maltaromaticum]
MVNNQPNTEGLVKHIKNKSEKSNWNVEQAIKEMKSLSIPINFSSVAKRAQVSKTYLYKHVSFRKEILTLRLFPSVIKKEEKKSINSKDVLIDVLRSRIQVLEKEKALLKMEVKQLKLDNKEQLGELYDSI